MITPALSVTATERVLPNFAVDFTTANLDPRVTFARTTDSTAPATFVNSSGYVASATNNQPRFDYDPVALTCRGLLVEESRANLITYSATYSNAAWNKARSSVSTNAILSPDGGTSSFSFTEDTSTATHFIRQTATVVNGSTYVVWAYLKANTRSWVLLSIAAGSGYYFDIANGVVGSAFSGTGTVSNPFITAAGNGWYRCGFTVVAGSTTGGIDIYLATGDNSVSYTGNGSSGVYIWGSQIELGAFATTYIPTTNAALTRNADVATVTGTNFTSWFNASAGTFVTQWQQRQVNTASSFFVYSAVGDIRSPQQTFGIRFYGNNGSNVALGTPVANTVYKVAIGYTNGAGERVAINGGAVSTNGTNYSSASAPTLLAIGAQKSGQPFYFNGWIQKLSFWPQLLTNAEIQAFSK